MTTRIGIAYKHDKFNFLMERQVGVTSEILTVYRAKERKERQTDIMYTLRKNGSLAVPQVEPLMVL